LDAAPAVPLAVTESKPRAPRFYEPELDVLRFFAFLSVFFFHALPSSYVDLESRLGHVIPSVLQAARNAMSFGVCMFFLLSSYLITKLLILERESTGSIHMKSFYVRRILRIWPLYLGFLFAMWFLGRIHVFYPVETGRLFAFLFFSGNIYSGFFGFTFNPILPLWTVSIEEQFYILWPGLARGGLRLLRNAARAIVAIAIAAIVFLRLHAVDPVQAVWTSSLTHFQFFALGALLALRFKHRLPTFSTLNRFALASAGLLLLLLAGGPLHVNSADVAAVSAPLLAAGYEGMALGIVLLFLAVLGSAQGKGKVPPTLTYLGKISYGLYVFHDLSLQVCGSLANRYNIHMGFRTIAAAGMTLLLAMLSYRFFEKPFLILKDKFALIQTRPA
jgi:peptidoglycan/LPS O-acetylase OafA/YrhL